MSPGAQNLDLPLLLLLNKGEVVIDDLEPEDLIYDSTGRIVTINESDRFTTIGRFHVQYVDIEGAIAERVPIFDLFDARASTLEYYEALYDYDTGEVRDDVADLLDLPSAWGNLLILERLEILPSYRHSGLGLRVMRRLIQRLGRGAVIVAIKPFPLQLEWRSLQERDEPAWRRQLRLDDFGKNRRVSTAKLKRYYKKLGFVTVKGTELMARAVDLDI